MPARWLPAPPDLHSTTVDLQNFENHKGASAQLEAYKRAGYTLTGFREVDLPNGAVRSFRCTETRKKPSGVSTIKIAIDGTRGLSTVTTKVGDATETTTTENDY